MFSVLWENRTSENFFDPKKWGAHNDVTDVLMLFNDYSIHVLSVFLFAGAVLVLGFSFWGPLGWRHFHLGGGAHN